MHMLASQQYPRLQMARPRLLAAVGNLASAVLATKSCSRAGLAVVRAAEYQGPPVEDQAFAAGTTPVDAPAQDFHTIAAPSGADAGVFASAAYSTTPAPYSQPPVQQYPQQQPYGQPQLAPQPQYQYDQHPQHQPPPPQLANAGVSAVGHTPDPELCDYDEDCINTVGLMGKATEAPFMQRTSTGKLRALLTIATYCRPGGKSMMVSVEAWESLAAQLVDHVQGGTPLCINGRLAFDYRNNGPSGIKVVAENFWLVAPESIPSTATVTTSGYQGNGMARRTSTTSRGPEATRLPSPADTSKLYHEQGLSAAEIAAQYGVQVNSVIEKVLLAATTGAYPDMDWRRMCEEVSLGVSAGLPIPEVAEVIAQSIANNPGEVTRSGAPKLKPMRDTLLSHPVLGPVVQQQEAEQGSGLTYNQCRVVQAMCTLGVELNIL